MTGIPRARLAPAALALLGTGLALVAGPVAVAQAATDRVFAVTEGNTFLTFDRTTPDTLQTQELSAAPPPVVPEITQAALLPLSALGCVGLLIALRRRSVA